MTAADKLSAAKSTLPSVDRRVEQQVRRDLLIFAGFIAAGFILSVNLDVVGILYGWANEFQHLQMSKLLGTIIVASVGLTLYIITRYHSHVRELRSRLQTEERARRVAMHDQLTGLPNRRHLKGVLNWLLSENDGAKRLAVVMLNLDKFAEFNDTHGRAVGDEMLMNVGKVLNLRAGVDGAIICQPVTLLAPPGGTDAKAAPSAQRSHLRGRHRRPRAGDLAGGVDRPLHRPG